MLTFLRNIRRSLIESSSVRKYLLYAIGEVGLVVIGILIALQINNWNEGRKTKSQFEQSILGLAEDIRSDTSIIQSYISRLKIQEQAAKLIIPIFESEEKMVVDSMEFLAAYLNMSNSIGMDFNREIWDEIRRSGLHKTYADPHLIDLIQRYYHRYWKVSMNWESARSVRMEMRWLKYELVSQSDLDRHNSSDNPRPYSAKAFETIFNEKRVVDLTKAIYYTSSLFKEYFETCKTQATEVIELIDKTYGDRKDNAL